MGGCCGSLPKSSAAQANAQADNRAAAMQQFEPTAPPMPLQSSPSTSQDGFVVPPTRCLDGTGQVQTHDAVHRPQTLERTNSGMPPAGTITVSGAAEFTAVPRNEAQQLLCLAHLTAPAAGEKGSDARPPVTVSAVIDRSGSMSGEKLKLVQRTLHFVIRELRSEDRLGIIAYDDSVTEPLPLTFMTPEGKEVASVAVDRIVPGGCTNLSGGLFAGLDQVAGRPLQLEAYNDDAMPFGLRSSASRNGMQRMPSMLSNMVSMRKVTAPPAEKKVVELPPSNAAPAPNGGVSSVWLFTDGLANSGVQDTDGIVAGMKERRPIDGPSVFTFGFGAQHNDSMLRNISEYGHGMYYFIQDAASIPRAFAECLGGLLSVVAQNIAVTFTAAKGVRILRVLGQDNVTLHAGGRNAKVILGDMYAEEQRDIVAEISVAPEAGDALTNIDLVYDEAPGGRNVSAATEVRVERPAQPPKQPLQSLPVLDRQRNRLNITQALRSARDEASAGRYEAACKVLQQAGESVKKSATGGEEYCRELLDDLRECEEGSRSRVEWQARGEKTTTNIEMGHRKQRSCGISAKSGRKSHMYSNTRQSAMIAEWCNEE